MNDNWHDRADELHSSGMRNCDIYRQLCSEGYEVSKAAIKMHFYRQRKKAKQTDISKPKKTSGVIFRNYDPKTFYAYDEDNLYFGKSIRFALIGDTHFGSKYAQIDNLNKFYDICAAYGVKDIYHTGDITDGIKMRPGHEYELYVISSDEMLDDVVDNYPSRDGITTHFISGNHDSSVYKHVGYDICKRIAEKRVDLDYLGRDCAVVRLTPNCTLELRHPWDGSAYAQSYKPQKMIEAMEADTKPNILAIGHYHKVEYLFYRNVHCFQTGCFQGQTPFSRGKGLAVNQGGWIIDISVDDEGHINKLNQIMIPFYSSVMR